MSDTLRQTAPTASTTPDPPKDSGGPVNDPACCTAPGDGDPGPPKG